MNILLVTNMFPDAARPANGIFVAEQMAAVRKAHPDVHFDVCYVEGENKGRMEYLRSILQVDRSIRCGHYDLVHVHYGLSGLFLLSPFRQRRVPVIVTFHGSDIQPAGGNGHLAVRISQEVARRATACITLNPAMDAMVRRFNPHTFIVPCGVDLDSFPAAPHACPKEKARIVFPSHRGMKVKDYPLFAETLELLRQKHGIHGEAHELKGLTRPQVARLFQQADLLLMTSRSEGSPQAVKEALACQLPVVSTPVGDVPHLLEGVARCFVSHARSAEELARLAAKSLSGQGTGITGREKIRQLRLDAHSVANRIYEIYEQSLH